MLFAVFILGGCLFVAAPSHAASATLVATSTVVSLEAINWGNWDNSGNIDTIYYSFTATSTIRICAVVVPVSRASAATLDGHRIPIMVGITASTSTNPSNTISIANTSFSAGLYTQDYSVAIQPHVSTSTAIVYFTLLPNVSTLACQQLLVGETLWIQIYDLDFPMSDTDPMRYGNNLSLTNTGSRFCYRMHGTSLGTCMADGSGAIAILDDTAASTLNLIFNDPVTGYSALDVDSGQGAMARLLSDLAKWLFAPSQTTVLNYNTARNDLQTRIPWGWFAEASSTFSSLDDAADTTTSSVLTMTVNDGSATRTAAIFDPTGIKNFIPATVTSTIKNLIGVGFWALFFTFLFMLATGHHSEHDYDN